MILEGGFWAERADFRPKEADFGSETTNFGCNRCDSKSESVVLSLLRLISGLKEPYLGLRGLWGTYG